MSSHIIFWPPPPYPQVITSFINSPLLWSLQSWLFIVFVLAIVFLPHYLVLLPFDTSNLLCGLPECTLRELLRSLGGILSSDALAKLHFREKRKHWYFFIHLCWFDLIETAMSQNVRITHQLAKLGAYSGRQWILSKLKNANGFKVSRGWAPVWEQIAEGWGWNEVSLF